MNLQKEAPVGLKHDKSEIDQRYTGHDYSSL